MLKNKFFLTLYLNNFNHQYKIMTNTGNQVFFIVSYRPDKDKNK